MSEDSQQLDEDELERRKQLRAGNGRVEQARNAPVPDKPAPAEPIAPAQGAEQE